eukprot:gene2015-33441_t
MPNVSTKGAANKLSGHKMSTELDCSGLFLHYDAAPRSLIIAHCSLLIASCNIPKSGDKPAQRLVPVGVLGKGGQGVVMRAHDQVHGQDVAVKYIQKDWCAKHQKYILRELINHWELSKFGHPHIVEFLEVVRTPNYLGLILEYVEGPSLYKEKNRGKKTRGRLKEHEARFIFQQLILAVDFCFKLGKVNRDLKPANILVMKISENTLPHIKLCDFGFR